MRRLMSAMLALSVFGAATAAQADTTKYHDPEGRFNLTVPTGWTAGRPTEPKIAAIIVPPAAETLGGACLVLVTPTPETRSVSQAEIDAAFGALFTREFWTAALQASGKLKDVTIDTVGSRDQGGHKVYFVVANVTSADAGTEFKAKGRQELHAIPGSIQFVNCSAKVETYGSMEADFTTIFTSYEPKSGEYIASAPQSPPTVLTLYAGRFDGATRIVAQDVPNLPVTGWSGPTASLALAGFGQWEVCDGVNYAGTCHLLSSSTVPTAPTRIGSVRRYLGNPRDMRAAAGLAGQGAGAAYALGVDRARSRR